MTSKATRPLLLAALCLLNLTRLTAETTVTPAPAPLPASLTPPAPATPRINGPAVFGVRPGSPFLYTIPATGERPVTFSADGLPDGLQLNSSSGIITGVLKQKGEFITTLHASNKLGHADKKFRIVVGEDIALTPPMGWNSYNVWGCGVDQEKTVRSARAMIAAGLDQHGWTYVNMDDGWQGQRRGPSNALQADTKRFNDIKQMCADIHDLGLKVGLYHTPWVQSYGGKAGGTSEDPKGLWNPKEQWPGKNPPNIKRLPKAIGKYSFVAADARQFAEWGFDYLKYDWAPVEAPETKEIADALRATGRDIVLSLSNNHPNSLFAGIQQVAPLAQSWRTTGDINDSWRSVSGIGFNQDKWAPFARPGHWNDPDMLVVGYVGWGKPRPTNLTPDQQYSHISMWCLLSAPLIIGCDLEKLDPFTLGLLTNDEVLAIDQDELGSQAVRVGSNGAIDFYLKHLADGSFALGLFNRGEQPASTGLDKIGAMGLSGNFKARDLWRQKDIADFDPNKSSFTLPPYGVLLLRLWKTP
jgi:alpha-galactosidase